MSTIMPRPLPHVLIPSALRNPTRVYPSAPSMEELFQEHHIDNTKCSVIEQHPDVPSTLNAPPTRPAPNLLHPRRLFATTTAIPPTTTHVTFPPRKRPGRRQQRHILPKARITATSSRRISRNHSRSHARVSPHPHHLPHWNSRTQSNRIFFVYLRGTLPDVPGLDAASRRITSEATLETGHHADAITYTVPLRTTAFNDYTHLAIRDASGRHVETLRAGWNDVVVDTWIPGL